MWLKKRDLTLVIKEENCLADTLTLLLFSHSVVWVFATSWTAARQASLSFTLYRSLFKLTSIESVIPSCPLLSPSPTAFNPSQHQDLFSWAIHIRWPWYWSFSFSISPSNEYSGLISFRRQAGFACSPRDSQESSPTPQFKSINSSTLSFLYGLTLTSIHDYWNNHSFD